MKNLRKFKVALVAVGIWGLTACAKATAPKAPMTSDHLLNVLVQIATQEDLADEKRIGDLLGLDIVMIPEPPFEMKDGRMATSSTGDISKNPGYLATQGSNFSYRHTTKPMRGARMSLGFAYEKNCINYKDVIEKFKKYGELKSSAPPLVTPLPNGATPAPANTKSQTTYGYGLKGTRSNVSLVFYYTECLTAIYINQPVTDQ